MSDTIRSFTPHRQKWQARIVLDEADARAVVERAEEADVPVATMLRLLVRKALGRKGAPS